MLTNLAPFTTIGGPGAEDVVRHMVIELLTRHPGNTVEIVLSRQDAWHLFGMDIGTFQDDQIPGLTLTEDAHQTHSYLLTAGAPRRLFITCGSDGSGLDDVLARPWGELTVVSLSPDEEPTIAASADGDLTGPAKTERPLVSQRFLLLPRPAAFKELTTMPTLVRQHA